MHSKMIKTQSKIDVISLQAKKRGSSISQLSKLRSLSDNLPDVGCGRFCRVDYLSVTGKWLTFSKLMALVLIPVMAGWAFTIYSLADNIQQRDETLVARDTMIKAVKLGRIIYKIQKERDMSILYLSKIGPGTKSFVIREYEKTDNAIVEMWAWPEEFTVNSNPHFRSKNALTTYLNQHRAKLELNVSRAYDEIKFYTEVVDFMNDWLIINIKESGFGYIWKTLVVFQKLTRCMLDTGIERAYGAMFFAQGNFPDPNFYDFYFRRIHRFKYNYKSATFYSDLVDALIIERSETTNAINAYRNQVKFSNFSGIYTSLLDAQYYFDNVTLRVDYMFSLQNLAGDRVSRRVNATVAEHVTSIIIYSVIATIVILACPVIMFLSETLTSHIQTYSQILVKASNDLDIEKTKTDSLLYQMLPKAVVDRLKKSSRVDSEYFKSATVMFSSVVNFTRLSIEFSPMELVEVLNVLYTSFDEKIGKYDVYKVETINDTYMVVSGVPVPNGMRHASEISYLALDIRHMISHAVYTPAMRIPIQLLIGISSGSVSAGIVGTAMLRYCLFGDTVNIASRMRSYSKPNRIHLSEPTQQNLSKSGNFRMHSRGNIEIKGKGRMETFWLLGARGKADLDIPPSSYRLPGELEEISDESSTGPGPSSQEVMVEIRKTESKHSDSRMKKRRTSILQAQQQKLSNSGLKPDPASLTLEEYQLY